MGTQASRPGSEGRCGTRPAPWRADARPAADGAAVRGGRSGPERGGEPGPQSSNGHGPGTDASQEPPTTTPMTTPATTPARPSATTSAPGAQTGPGVPQDRPEDTRPLAPLDDPAPNGHRHPKPGEPGAERGAPQEFTETVGGDPGDSLHFRSVLGRFATGVVAITALDPDGGEPRALIANSFTSVSLDPPLVAFCVAHTSRTWPRLRSATSVCVNVLAEGQQGTSVRLASGRGDRFEGLRWRASPGGNPILDGALAWIECSIDAEHPAGDHVIVVARVHRLENQAGGGPLVFFRGGYGGFRS